MFALVFLCAGPARAAAPAHDAIAQAFNRLYNFDFRGSHAVLSQYISTHEQEPLPYAIRSAAYLFYELDRLGVLESEFLTDDRRIAEKKRLRPDPAIKTQLFEAIGEAQSRAAAVLAARPDDHDALFAMCITLGVTTDYTALVERRQLHSLSSAKQSNTYAQKLLQADPRFYDAYLTTGLSEYLVGSLPFFIRWFVRFDAVQGSKEQGVKNLQLVAHQGHYLGPFAKILLSIVSLREKRPWEAQKLLEELAREYPANPLFRKELAKISLRLGGSHSGASNSRITLP